MSAQVVNCRKKPIIVQALQWDGTNLEECKKFCGDTLKIEYPTLDNSVAFLKLNTLEGEENVLMNAFIIRGVRGELYPCEESIFRETYDIV